MSKLKNQIRKTRKELPSTVEEDLKSIKESELLISEREKMSPLLKKAIIAFSALLIIFLFLSITYLQYPLFGIIEGQIESRSVDNNILQMKDFRVVFTDNAMESLKDSFSINQEVETSRCLLGEKNGEDYFISEVYTPKIYEQSFRHVTSEPCSNNTLIMFHTHPYKSCIASSTDLNTLNSNQKTNPDMIMIIMCEPDRFTVYK